MASEILEREDSSMYVVAGVSDSFKKKLQKLVATEATSDSDVVLLDEGMTEWLLAYIREEKAKSGPRDRQPSGVRTSISLGRYTMCRISRSKRRFGRYVTGSRSFGEKRALFMTRRKSLGRWIRSSPGLASALVSFRSQRTTAGSGRPTIRELSRKPDPRIATRHHDTGLPQQCVRFLTGRGSSA